jgi:hypothetical protein
VSTGGRAPGDPGDGADGAPRASIPADIDAEDKIVWGLTFRQLAIVAAAAAAVYGLWRVAGRALPPAALLAAGTPLVAAAAAVALGRRDGRPLDAWLASALAMRRVPRAQAPGGPADPAAAGLARTAGRPLVPAPLRLPADSISPTGLLRLPGGGVAGSSKSSKSSMAAVVAAGTVSLGLRTAGEQAALLGGFARWLNSLTAPAQITVCTARVDLRPHADAVRAAAPLLPHPALEQAAADHADFLEDLAAARDPLRRHVLVTVRADGEVLAARRGQDTARALAALGVDTQMLDGPAVTAALAAAIDPYAPPVPGPRATPGTPITTAFEPDGGRRWD